VELPDYPTLFWITAALAIVIVGIAKAGFGSGPGLLATPLIALTIPVAEAAALLLPLLIVADLLTVRHYRHSFDRSNLSILLPGAMIGIVIGAFFFGYFSDNERVLEIGMGVLALLFVAFQSVRAIIFGALKRYRAPNSVGVALGAMAGFTSTLAHAGGPPAAVYLMPQQLPRHVFVGTTVVFFMSVNVVKLVPYSILGLFHLGNLLTILILCPFAFLGVRLGIGLNRRFDEKWFNIIIYSLLFLTGLQLLVGRSLFSLFS